MSKTTKIIAGLGVVAGLSVAAMPAFTFAAETVTGDVQVQAEVVPAIAMTISGNNDSGTHAPVTYSVVASPEGNPSENGYYERSGSAGSYVYTASTDTTVDGAKTYYTQDAAISYAAVDNFNPSTAASSEIDGHTTPATAVLGTSSSYISLLPNATAIGDSTNNFRSTITVYTNNATGYDLTLLDKDADTALVNANGDTIPATGATTLERGTAAWGYRVSGDTDWLAVPASTGTAAPIASLDTRTSGGDETIVEYGVATSADQATGIYADTIVYTATTR